MTWLFLFTAADFTIAMLPMLQFIVNFATTHKLRNQPMTFQVAGAPEFDHQTT